MIKEAENHLPASLVVLLIESRPSQLSQLPYLQNTTQVLESVSDLGRTLPFVAPVFMLFKIMVDIERRAQEVDVKCCDLVERVTFMLGHLTALKNIEITEATRTVIERMKVILIDVTALIEAYRRQRPVARRLSLNNREKFSICADKVNRCCNDLMMCLQIQQSGELDVITRSAPNDPDDDAAILFLADNGSIENVKHHPELVEDFAKQRHMSMDNKVMEQLNGNINDAIAQNQAHIEQILQDNVGAAIVGGMKALAVEMNQAELEQKFICIQCSKEYRNSQNGPKSCSFHKAPYDGGSKSYGCCRYKNPCQFNYHRSHHHSDYPYGDFFAYAWGIMIYTDTHKTWTEVKDTNLETRNKSYAAIGEMLRWASHGNRISEPTLFVQIGTIYYSDPYFFDTFTNKGLESMGKVISLTDQTQIFRTSEDSNEFAMAEWILSGGSITGARLTVKVATSEAPFIQVCPFDPSTCSKAGDVLCISKGGFQSYTPESEYKLPENTRIGPEITDKPVRPVRKDFKPVRLMNFRCEEDYFEGELSVFNNHAAGSLNSITISAVTASFRLVGDEEYQPVTNLDLKSLTRLPKTIAPKESWNFRFSACVPRSKEDIEMDVRWWNCAFIARHRPLRLKLTLEEIAGEECSLVSEYVFNPYPFKGKEEDDIAYLSFDDPERFERYAIRVKKGSDNAVLKVAHHDIDVTRLQKIVYNAIKTEETEIDMEIGRVGKDDDLWEWRAWALVDLSCRRIYAIKILLQEGKTIKKKRFASLGYVAVPSYGDIIEKTRPIQYAKESVTLPELQTYDVCEYAIDDDFDEFAPETPKPVVQTPAPAPAGVSESATGGQSFDLPGELTERLASIDQNLAGIAATTERLASIDQSLARIAATFELSVPQATRFMMSQRKF
ncbi:hypothetical protein M422DRAFT_76003 [Sphaerobolus stellatus SS14]|uniref:Uncharacterized protein n=1 Tax=Sphaerobolus stellatus (strain SS14) TaxID=990650 RepID=A0A0C9U509_SPHS4|nr:hypothetical protein M422DRAFT_76003 [Sphaerobolus stellatus SS14]